MTEQSRTLLKASFCGTFAETMLLPIWAVLTERVGGSPLDAGIGYAIFSIVTGIFVATIGQTSWFERNTKAMVFGGFFVAALGDIGYLLVRNKYELFAIQSLIGLSVGILNPSWSALYEEDEDSASKRWSFWDGGASFVVGVSALVGSFIMVHLGWSALFIAMGIADLPAIYFAFRVWKPNGV